MEVFTISNLILVLKGKKPMSDAAFGLILASFAVTVTLVVFILPMLYAVVISFSSYNHMLGRIERFVGFENYVRILTDPAFWSAWRVTLTYALISVPTQLIIGVSVALLLHQKLFARRVWRTAILAPMMVTPVVAALMWRLIYNPGNSILNHVLSLLGIAPWTSIAGPSAIVAVAIADIWLGSPFIVLICLATLQGIPEDLYEAASLDGAKAHQKFISITLPYLSNVLLIGALFRTIDATRVFDTLFVLTGGAFGTTNTMMFFYTRLFQTFNIDRATAFAVIMIIMTAIITLPITTKLLRDIGKVRDH